MTPLSIGIVGGGVGGLAAAIALRAAGHEVAVFEKASRYGRIGADVNMTPNAVRAADGLGIGEALRKAGAQPTHRISRQWDTGEETSRLEMSAAAERDYGAPQITIHRADLLEALSSRLPDGVLALQSHVVGVTDEDDGAMMHFGDGTEQRFDLIIGADGIHSVVRTAMFGEEHPEFTGLVSFRAAVSREKLAELPNIDAFTKWWGPDPATQIVTFPLNRGREQFVFATTAQDDWREESWTLPGDVDELRSIYRGFHPDARALLDACDAVTKSALYVREPMPRWSEGHITLLGDACHPMVPFMAQGACQAFEDAVVLSRVIDAMGDTRIETALSRYEQIRRERTARIQRASRSNEWLKVGGNADWVYGYDAWSTPLT
ncbi:salicylate hydroxylase [Rhodanobacter glycinis]|uniref:Salicylate hydroxylase n=1 Tax=Rhodanobacter glycinis TaxID=582702 RepID=A0A5B9DX64_9GAMM|nr:FAD-dependent monooxygenase [Rhodanobacter glycinis]QEE24039.1 salicylate hydroxylase [Rhodanobacter glycinis]